MWALLSILFGVIVLAMCVLALWAAWTVFIFLIALVRRRKTTVSRTAIWTLAGLPIAFVVVAFATVLLIWHASQPDVIFETELGFEPPPDTTVINADAFVLGDSGHAHIHFRTSPQTINRIVGMGFTAGPVNYRSNLEPPAWFTPPSAPPAATYTAEGLRPPARTRFSSEFASLVFDPTTGEAWYFYSGID